MDTRGRPLSPHIGIYQPQLTSVLSITHRVTGVALTVGTLMLIYWLLAAAAGPEAFARAQGFVGSWIGLLLLFAWSVALFYHLCNGIRHLLWDAGVGLELKEAYASGWAVLIATGVLTLLTWIVGLASMGG